MARERRNWARKLMDAGVRYRSDINRTGPRGTENGRRSTLRGSLVSDTRYDVLLPWRGPFARPRVSCHRGSDACRARPQPTPSLAERITLMQLPLYQNRGFCASAGLWHISRKVKGCAINDHRRAPHHLFSRQVDDGAAAGRRQAATVRSARSASRPAEPGPVPCGPEGRVTPRPGETGMAASGQFATPAPPQSRTGPC